MDWNISKKIGAFKSQPVARTLSYPNYSATPTHDFINPGVGGGFNLFEDFVPIYSKNLQEKQKKIDVQKNLDQVGSGETKTIDNEDVKEKMDPELFKSFQHPRFVDTGKILFSKKRQQEDSLQEKEVKKLKTKNEKKETMKHKFQFL